jgi:hypothetical protein
MGKEQNIRVAYVKPEIKTAHVLMGSMILEVSSPGDQPRSSQDRTYGRVK